MNEKSNEENSEREFEKIIAAYTDNDLRTVLKKRKLYRKEAAEFAIQEAIRRQIIFSEQDLFAREFKEEKEKFSIFPDIENERARKKFRKSLSRSLLLLGTAPIIYGGVKIYESQIFEGIAIFIFGVIWSFSSFKLMQTVNFKLLNLLSAMLLIAVAYIIKAMIDAHFLTTIDILVVLIAVGFVLYGIGFLKKLKD